MRESVVWDLWPTGEGRVGDIIRVNHGPKPNWFYFRTLSLDASGRPATHELVDAQEALQVEHVGLLQ